MTYKQKSIAVIVFYVLLIFMVVAGKSWAGSLDIDNCNCSGEYRISRGEYADVTVYKVEVCSWSAYTGTTYNSWHNAYDTRFPESIGKEYFYNFSEAKEFLRLLKSKAKKDLAKQKLKLKMESLKWQPIDNEVKNNDLEIKGVEVILGGKIKQ